ncbi:hypothetical protein P170DRAFT_438615 [Aspergillus steynii IBT 23096]|uniref:Leucine rich repeat domain protein n=1 Tax=Aspergillus steynii IBT 23096 TaxID=1392250 RepID=A0A2I2G206_9EURO|nr:uncharacterized protein P170DRAFT_438615 [Aspergillus steynii IBT 23096]PLB46913.1 hypothetical protein P170DRAFT_438615 [Aspergillus steynii IBT 23096]
MDIVPPSYQSATTRDAWSIIARYIPSSDLCAAALVCQRWHELFMPFLWGDPASHFGTDNDAVYVALTRFRRTLKYARLVVRMLTHTLHLPPALSEIYGGPRPEWLKEVLHYLPNLQSLVVSKLPFFDHNAMMALKGTTRSEQQADSAVSNAYNIRLLLADREPNTTSQGLAEALLRFQELIYLDLSYTTPARDRMVLSTLSQLEHLQVLKLRGIGLKDSDAEFLANAVGSRVRFLDLRGNMLTDMAVRSLLQASFLIAGDAVVGPNGDATNTGTFNSFSHLTPSFSNSKWLSSSNLDEQFVKALTQPLTGRSWVEGLTHSGITHLYIADNQITVEGAASLLASSRLHVLDVGTVDTVESLTRGPSSIPPQSGEGPQELPGAEKLIPVLGSAARENLTYLRAHHVICTNDNPYKESVSLNCFLPELPAETETDTADQQTDVELDAANEIHELPAQEAPIFELEGSPISPSSDSPVHKPSQPIVYEDEPLPLRRRGSVFAPEVIEGPSAANNSDGLDVLRSPLSVAGMSRGLSVSTVSNMETFTDQTGTIPQCNSPVPMEDSRGQMIQELLSKRPKNQSLPRRDHKDNSFPYLHPSHVPHLETLVLTDVPSHLPANSPHLKSLIRFITACSNEALLATLQAGSDYSLPPGRDRVKAEQERSRSLFALRRLVLEITPTEKLTGPARLTAWKPASYHTGASKSSTGDRDLENLWTASMDDFSFFDETECGIPENDRGKYFPMAALNEKVTLMPEDDDSGGSTPVSSSPGLLHRNSPLPKHMRSDVASRSSPINGTEPPQVEEPEVDLVAELAAFRRSKKVEYEEVVRRDRKRRSTTGSASLLSPSTSSIRSVSPSPSLRTIGPVSTAQLSMAHFVEGHWKGEVKIVRNAAPKGRSGVVDMYGNYFEKGYLYP